MDVTSSAPRATLKMQSVKAECDMALPGSGKDAALKHYKAAEMAHWGRCEADCNGELDAARRALAQTAISK